MCVALGIEWEEYKTFICGYVYPEFTNESSHRHHILPICMGGTDDQSNLILLTVSGHELAHRLLAKAAPKEYKKALVYAHTKFKQTYNKAHKTTSTEYEPAYTVMGGGLRIGGVSQTTRNNKKPPEQPVIQKEENNDYQIGYGGLPFSARMG